MPTINLGRKNSNSALASPSKGPSISYPSFSVNDVVLPLTHKDVGKTIQAIVTLKVNKAGAEIQEYGDKRKHFNSSFSIMNITIKGRGKITVDHTSDKGQLDELERQEAGF